MDESVFPLADVDEGRLDVMEDVRHAAAVDITCRLPFFFPFRR